ncbi:hypothetical protein BN903_6 [Halorubrum sp. AJ67]|nr:hypothetical protein BN903_6 [Halorubrum sp. AJ67]
MIGHQLEETMSGTKSQLLIGNTTIRTATSTGDLPQHDTD